MNLEQGVLAYLRAHATVGPIFRNATSPLSYRIYAEFLPESPTYPALRYARVSTAPLLTLSGPIGYAQVRLQLDVWDKTVSGCRTAADAVRSALDGLRDSVGGASISHGYIDGFSAQSELEGDRADFRITMDLIVTLTE